MKELLELSKEACVKAGIEILKHYDNFEVSLKSDKSPVTTADIASNEMIFKILNKSDIPICSEEKILESKDSIFWLIDPLDGTKEFIDKNGQFCVCIALIKDKKPIIGVIYIPVTKELFYSFSDLAFMSIHDGYCEKDIVSLNNLKSGKKFIVYSRRGKNVQAKNIAKIIKFKTFGLGSAIKFCRLAQGEASLYLRYSPSYIWDNAAGQAILNACGGAVFDCNTKQEISYNLDSLKMGSFIAFNSYSLNSKNKIFKIFDQQSKNSNETY